MTTVVEDAYDAVAKLYTELFLTQLERDSVAREWLAVFAELAKAQRGHVADLGYGPGYVVDYLSQMGVSSIGYDISTGLIAEARRAFPDLQFEVGDLTELDNGDSSLGGIVARHSIIHLLPSQLPEVFAEWLRVLEPGAAALVSFSGSSSAEEHGTPFDHKVITAYALFPDTITQQLSVAGFDRIEGDVRPPPEGGRPFTVVTVLARKPRPKS